MMPEQVRKKREMRSGQVSGKKQEAARQNKKPPEGGLHDTAYCFDYSCLSDGARGGT
ncbi:hypothetical protein U5O47_001344 [Cronobacter malonaticus]|nr:hypothetical protein [Cronobacter malonaticus]